MGKYEKLALLSLLFAAFLFMAFSGGDGPDGTSEIDPLTAALERRSESEQEPATTYGVPTEASVPEGSLETPGPERPEPPADEAVLSATVPPTGAPTVEKGEPASELPNPKDLLLDASVEAKTDLAQGALTKEKRILQSLRGLRPSKNSDYMEYAVKDGDTWAGLAQRFYRNGRYTRNLRIANEGLEDLEEGAYLLVPVYDVLAEVGTREPFRPEVRPAAPSGSPESAPSPGAAREPITRAVVHTVASGDNLSKISLRYYGTATRWAEIYDANSKVLASADVLEVGTKLTIPVLDLSKPAKASRIKPAASKSKTDSSTSTKKPKVD